MAKNVQALEKKKREAQADQHFEDCRQRPSAQQAEFAEILPHNEPLDLPQPPPDADLFQWAQREAGRLHDQQQDLGRQCRQLLQSDSWEFHHVSELETQGVQIMQDLTAQLERLKQLQQLGEPPVARLSAAIAELELELKMREAEKRILLAEMALAELNNLYGSEISIAQEALTRAKAAIVVRNVEHFQPLHIRGSIEECSTGGDHAIHAEMNAVLPEKKMWEGAIVFVTLIPCPQCFKMLAHAQVSYIIFLSDSGRYMETWELSKRLEKGPVLVPLCLLLEVADQLVDPNNIQAKAVFKSDVFMCLQECPLGPGTPLKCTYYVADYSQLKTNQAFQEHCHRLIKILFRLNEGERV